MKRAMLAVALFAAVALGQEDHHAMMVKNGEKVMGFSQEKTTHHFLLTLDGGAIDVRANDSKDAESVAEIRSHFQHIAQMFVAGNFNAPMLVHSTNVPGTATMARLKDSLHWQFEEIPRGARLNVIADNQEATNAVHDFLRFQIADHQTGDCTVAH